MGAIKLSQDKIEQAGENILVAQKTQVNFINELADGFGAIVAGGYEGDQVEAVKNNFRSLEETSNASLDLNKSAMSRLAELDEGLQKVSAAMHTIGKVKTGDVNTKAVSRRGVDYGKLV